METPLLAQVEKGLKPTSRLSVAVQFISGDDIFFFFSKGKSVKDDMSTPDDLLGRRQGLMKVEHVDFSTNHRDIQHC